MNNIRSIGASIACAMLFISSCSGGGNSATNNDGNSNEAANSLNETESTLDYSILTAPEEVWSCFFPSEPGLNTHVTFSNGGSGRINTVSGGSAAASFTWSNSGTLTNPTINISLSSESFVLFDFSFYTDLFRRDAFSASDSRGFDINCTRVKLEDL